ncbi:MAG: hypothetical protein H8E72_07465 [Candidatus Marinimicrobia bacterium]|nr:hypothetical protein [Candidatus Neomarinimicrobiota bacterium]
MFFRKNYYGNIELSFFEPPILSTSREDDIVFDPFCGSGSTGEMPLSLRRKFIGYEMNSKYYELSTLRLQKCIEMKII